MNSARKRGRKSDSKSDPIYSEFPVRLPVSITAVLTVGFCLSLAGQNAPPAAKGLTPRPTPADYQAVAKAGDMTIAADFAGHGVPTADGVFSTEDYVVVEVAMFGPAGKRLKLSYEDFSLRMNGKKSPLPAQPFEQAFNSLKDPEWAPPPTESKSKTGINSNGQGESAPPPAKMPMNLRLAMEQKVRAATLPEGERPLPSAGLIFFRQGGKLSNMRSLELVYDGAAGKATLPLQ
jgi:hypothetical protein